MTNQLQTAGQLVDITVRFEKVHSEVVVLQQGTYSGHLSARVISSLYARLIGLVHAISPKLLETCYHDVAIRESCLLNLISHQPHESAKRCRFWRPAFLRRAWSSPCHRAAKDAPEHACASGIGLRKLKHVLKSQQRSRWQQGCQSHRRRAWHSSWCRT